MTDHLDFAGFGPVAFDWLDDLATDNSRAFFAATRPTFEHELHQPFAALLRECAAWSGGRPRVFRQLRDQRFATSREQPYWPSVAGEIAGSGVTALVVDLSPAGLTAFAGCRRPFTRDQLRRYRIAAAEPAAGADLAEIVEALRGAGLEVAGHTLRAMPRGLPRDHERAALLRHTALFGGATLAPVTRRRRGRGPARAIDRDAALAHLSSTWAQLDPLGAWLDAHVGAPDAPAADAA